VALTFQPSSANLGTAVGLPCARARLNLIVLDVAMVVVSTVMLSGH
jgi:hypothetical protein